MQGYIQEFPANSVICREGDPSTDLYFLQSGKLLICSLVNKELKVLSRISAGEFIGELSFFDGKVRSSNVISLEKCVLVLIPREQILNQLPEWYLKICTDVTKRIRHMDQIIQETKIRRSGIEENRPLTIDEQREFIKLLSN